MVYDQEQPHAHYIENKPFTTHSEPINLSPRLHRIPPVLCYNRIEGNDRQGSSPVQTKAAPAPR